MEWDILDVLPHWKLIINIEVKSGTSVNSIKKAAKQTNIHLGIFKTIFGAHLPCDWKFIKAAFTPNLDLRSLEYNICEYCTQFIISDSEILDMNPWIEKILDYGSFKEEVSSEYEDLLVGLIGFSSIHRIEKLNELIADPLKFSKETELKMSNQTSSIQWENERDRNLILGVDRFGIKRTKRGNTEDEKILSEYLCYNLTADQRTAVNDPSLLIIIQGEYGCGKTYVLKERAKQFSEKHPESKIAYINIVDFNHKVGMMDMVAENDFMDYTNVDVVLHHHLKDHYFQYEDELKGVDRSFRQGGEESSLVLKHFLKKSSTYNHMFVDEMPPFKDANSEYELFSMDKTYCIAMKCDVHNNDVNEEWIYQMEARYNAKRIILKNNMRNAETIMNVSSCFDRNDEYGNPNRDRVIPKKNIQGPVCYHYQNSHFFEKEMLIRAAIQKYFDQPKESVLVITENMDSRITRKLYTEVQEYFSADRNVVYLPEDDDYIDYKENIEEVKMYLEKPEGVLVTDIQSFHGAQARNIIIILNENCSSMNLKNMVLRTMAFAIIIHNDNINQALPGLVRDFSLHEHIQPGNTEQLICNNEEDDHRSSCSLQSPLRS